MTNNFEGWKHIATAPKDREVLVWDGTKRNIAEFDGTHWMVEEEIPVYPTHWRGCPPPPVESLPDDEE